MKCPFCDHQWHAHAECPALGPCEDCHCPSETAMHRCACSYPRGDNLTETRPVTLSDLSGTHE
jgi:hypothetical protein